MESIPHGTREASPTQEPSITGIASLYVLFLLLGGLAVLTVLVYAHTSTAIIGSTIAGLVAIAGVVYAVRATARMLRT